MSPIPRLNGGAGFDVLPGDTLFVTTSASTNEAVVNTITIVANFDQVIRRALERQGAN